MPAPPPPEASPAPAPKAPGLGPREVVRDAWLMVLRNPRETILPLLAIQVPIAVITTVVVTVLYLTTFKDEIFKSYADVILDGDRGGPLFVALITLAVQGLFAQVARGATVVSIAAVVAKRPLALPQALDPAFTRMGGLILLAIFLISGFSLLAVSLVGLVVLPYLGARLGLAFEAYMIEGVSPGRALARSWQVTQGNVIRLLGAIVLAALLSLIPFIVVSLVGAVSIESRSTEVVVNGILSAVQSVLLVPFFAFFTALTTIFYLRVRVDPNVRTAA